MAESTIVTGEFVRIHQTPASVGERLIALVIDYFTITVYVITVFTLLNDLRLSGDTEFALSMFVVILPAIFYAFLCESFNHGQSFGKQVMNIRVVKLDGSTPGVSAYLLRWLLFPIDFILSGGIGLLSVLLTKHSQRLGDLAAGTMVVKERNYRKIHVSLDEFDYLTKDYRPVYPQSADLSLEQVNIITRTLEIRDKDRKRRISLLANKIKETFSIISRGETDERFLRTILRDYQYYALEEI